ncbi:MAG: SDR family oxidoreductase [Candidatus Nanopelagicaceae bacterium]|nr:SDR family oxidoreductase [Candidatus Nanopelagicaceae bacterium]
MSNTEQTILITGASGHIGRSFVDHYLRGGFQVVAISNRGPMPTAANLTRISADLTEVGAGVKVLEDVLKIHSKIDFIINNAARQDVTLLKDENAQAIHNIFQVNVSSVAEMYSKIASNKFGVKSVLNLTSIEAVNARPGHSIYGASKAALEALTKSAAAEIAPIRSNALRLGLIERDGIRESWPGGVAAWEKSAPLVRMGTFSDILQAADFLLNATWITGSILTLDGGMSTVTNW